MLKLVRYMLWLLAIGHEVFSVRLVLLGEMRVVPRDRRDLKTSNILLSAEGVAKIADVGLAKMLTNADQYSLDHTAGTFAYAAPELILGTRCSEKVFPRTQHVLCRLAGSCAHHLLATS